VSERSEFFFQEKFTGPPAPRYPLRYREVSDFDISHAAQAMIC